MGRRPKVPHIDKKPFSFNQRLDNIGVLYQSGQYPDGQQISQQDFASMSFCLRVLFKTRADIAKEFVTSTGVNDSNHRKFLLKLLQFFES